MFCPPQACGFHGAAFCPNIISLYSHDSAAGKSRTLLRVELSYILIAGLKLIEGHGIWCPFDWPQCPSRKSLFGLGLVVLKEFALGKSGLALKIRKFKACNRAFSCVVMLSIKDQFGVLKNEDYLCTQIGIAMLCMCLTMGQWSMCILSPVKRARL